MELFDFHAHIVLKQSFNDDTDLEEKMSPSDVGLLVRTCTDLPYIIETQMSAEDLLSLGGPIVVGAALYGMESALAVAVSGLTNLLKEPSRSKLSVAFLKSIASNQCKIFTEFTMARVVHLYLGSDKFQLLTAGSVEDLSLDKINVFFTVEGCHSLVDQIQISPSGQNIYDPVEITKNLDKLTQQVSVLSLNLTHLQQSNICNHAFGMQLSDPGPFYPRGNGLSQDAFVLIQALFDRKICVDFKHMSYKSRHDFISALGKNRFTNPQPTICTHAGFTGVAFSDWPRFIHKRLSIDKDVLYLELGKNVQIENDPFKETAPGFNMSTINLFDEEIVWLVKQGGVIGLSMDRRILGYVGPFDDRPTGKDPNNDLMVDKEFFSKTEWLSLNIDEEKIGTKFSDTYCVTYSDVKNLSDGPIPTAHSFFYDHVLLHIKHFLQVCINAGIPLTEAQNHLAIGSDFDGLINPFLNFKTCLDMPGLYSYIQGRLRPFLMGLSDSSQWANQLDVADFTTKLFYGNGKNFITGFFQKPKS